MDTSRALSLPNKYLLVFLLTNKKIPKPSAWASTAIGRGERRIVGIQHSLVLQNVGALGAEGKKKIICPLFAPTAVHVHMISETGKHLPVRLARRNIVECIPEVAQ